MDLIDNLDKDSLKKSVPSFGVGDTVAVEVRIKEGEKERIQVFSGVVIAIKHSGVAKTFTVRRIVQGEGVERVFPFHSPKVAGVRVERQGRVRRAKLYYLRGRTGKAARIQEKRRSAEAIASSKTKKKRKRGKKAAPGVQQPEAQQSEAQQPEAQQPEAQQPEAKQPEAKQPEAKQPKQKVKPAE